MVLPSGNPSPLKVKAKRAGVLSPNSANWVQDQPILHETCLKKQKIITKNMVYHPFCSQRSHSQAWPRSDMTAFSVECVLTEVGSSVQVAFIPRQEKFLVILGIEGILDRFADQAPAFLRSNIKRNQEEMIHACLCQAHWGHWLPPWSACARLGLSDLQSR